MRSDTEEPASELPVLYALAGAIPPSPPRTVLRAVLRAERTHDQLLASGRRVHVRLDSGRGSVAIEVHDREGRLCASLSGTELLEMADGVPTPLR